MNPGLASVSMAVRRAAAPPAPCPPRLCVSV